MKSTLSFNLPQEQEEFTAACNGSKLLGEVQEFDNYLRGLVKYNNTLTEAQLEIVEAVRSELHKLVENIWD